ncbi:unnamed protein product [Protopolystoma xenopodis]|uniref:Uncharacterized protein n=1 Tax=Protopolystoma xenopodis TaxID=117903 RepID=A0A3S5CPB7_9PLAT|nr:unnamed protein product [Protopolystoma xenopodis]
MRPWWDLFTLYRQNGMILALLFTGIYVSTLATSYSFGCSLSIASLSGIRTIDPEGHMYRLVLDLMRPWWDLFTLYRQNGMILALLFTGIYVSTLATSYSFGCSLSIASLSGIRTIDPEGHMYRRI